MTSDFLRVCVAVRSEEQPKTSSLRKGDPLSVGRAAFLAAQTQAQSPRGQIRSKSPEENEETLQRIPDQTCGSVTSRGARLSRGSLPRRSGSLRNERICAGFAIHGLGFAGSEKEIWLK